MAMLPEDYIQRVSDETDIVSVIGEHVPLKKTGSEYVGLCPFHNEKSPSFSVSPGKGVFMCRGCGEAGNAIQFLMKTQGSSFQETVLSLGKRAGMPAPAPTARGQERDTGRYIRLQEVLDQATKVYKEELTGSRQAMSYLRERGVTDEMINRFDIGYAPRNGEILRQRMKNFTEKELIEAGLLYRSEYHEGEMKEWMSHRIIFPIHNAGGKPIAFGGRSLVPDAKRKYINTPETLLFKKGSELFGLFQGSGEIRKKNQVIVTEGYLDVVVPSGSGVGNVVAAMGTGFSQDNLRKLFRMSDTVVFCFDGDSAGHNAALRAMQLSAELVDDRKRCKFAFLPNGLDPDDHVREHGAEGFRDLIGKAQPMSKFMVNHFVTRNDMTCAEGKAGFARDAMDVIERVQAPILKALMIEDVRGIIGPNIPLPGVTPGMPAIVPEKIMVPKRSALRVFRENPTKARAEMTAMAAPSSSSQAHHGLLNGSAPSPSLQTASNGSNESEISSSSSSVSNVVDEGQKRYPQRLRFREAPTTMIESARQVASDHVPSQAMRMLACVLRAPMIAEFDFKVGFLTGAPQEIAAITELISIINPNNTQGKPTPKSEELIAEMMKGPHSNLIENVTGMHEFVAKDMNVFQEAAAMIARSAQKMARSDSGKRLNVRRPG